MAWVIGQAGSPPEGPAIASTDSRTAVNLAVNASRRSRAAVNCCGVTRAPLARNSRMYGPYSLARDGYVDAWAAAISDPQIADQISIMQLRSGMRTSTIVAPRPLSTCNALSIAPA